VSKGYEKVLVAGSSAGANLLITTTRKARRGAARPPTAAALLAPAVDLRAIGDSYVANDGRDPPLTRDRISKLAVAEPASLLPAAARRRPDHPRAATAVRPYRLRMAWREQLAAAFARLHALPQPIS
jgi:acetyl esterase/lipase